MAKLILTGDVNLMNVTDPATPFAKVAEEFRAADMVFSNLECCLYTPPAEHSFHNAANETVLCALADEAMELADIQKRSAAYRTALVPDGDRVRVI
jgi:hypothetical protein